MLPNSVQKLSGVLTAILTLVLMQDGNTSVLFSGFLRTAIATVRSRPYYDSRRFSPLLSLHSALITPIPHSMARSCMLLCADIHHCVGCRESLCIKMLGADPVAAQAAAFIAACCSTDDGCSMHAGREMPTSGVRTEIAVVRRGR
jgi:hypothetical protein